MSCRHEYQCAYGFGIDANIDYTRKFYNVRFVLCCKSNMSSVLRFQCAVFVFQIQDERDKNIDKLLYVQIQPVDVRYLFSFATHAHPKNMHESDVDMVNGDA